MKKATLFMFCVLFSGSLFADLKCPSGYGQTEAYSVDPTLNTTATYTLRCCDQVVYTAKCTKANEAKFYTFAMMDKHETCCIVMSHLGNALK